MGKKFGSFLAVVVMILACCSAAHANSFYAITNQIGYQGTIWNITDGSDTWTTATPRDASLYTVVGVPGSSNYNYLLSNWSEHHTSNQNNSFIQLAETGNPSVTSATGSWDSTMKIFTVTVTGQNAPYPWSRFWQPDNGVAWGVTFTSYTYTFTAKFSNAAVLKDGYYVNSGSPVDIDGNFSGQFVVTADVNKNPITNGDTYGFNIHFDEDLFAALDLRDAYGNPTSIYNEFGAAAVPEPATFILLGSGLFCLAGYRMKKRGDK